MSLWIQRFESGVVKLSTFEKSDLKKLVLFGDEDVSGVCEVYSVCINCELWILKNDISHKSFFSWLLLLLCTLSVDALPYIAETYYDDAIFVALTCLGLVSTLVR